MHIYLDKQDQDFNAFLTWLSMSTLVGFDTETTGLDPHTSKILLLQFGDMNNQFLLDPYYLGMEAIHKVFDVILTRRGPNVKTMKLVLHNAKFDWQMIKSNFGIDIPADHICDTLIADKLLTMGRKFDHKLDEVLEKYIGVKISKGLQKSWIENAPGDVYTFKKIKIYVTALFSNYKRILREF